MARVLSPRSSTVRSCVVRDQCVLSAVQLQQERTVGSLSAVTDGLFLSESYKMHKPDLQPVDRAARSTGPECRAVLRRQCLFFGRPDMPGPGDTQAVTPEAAPVPGRLPLSLSSCPCPLPLSFHQRRRVAAGAGTVITLGVAGDRGKLLVSFGSRLCSARLTAQGTRPSGGQMHQGLRECALARSPVSPACPCVRSSRVHRRPLPPLKLSPWLAPGLAVPGPR